MGTEVINTQLLFHPCFFRFFVIYSYCVTIIEFHEAKQRVLISIARYTLLLKTVNYLIIVIGIVNSSTHYIGQCPRGY